MRRRNSGEDLICPDLQKVRSLKAEDTFTQTLTQIEKPVPNSL